MFDAVLLDVDGVLIKNPYRTIVFPEVARRIVKDAKVQDFVSFMMRESIRRIREGKLVGAYDWDDIVRTVCREIGASGSVSVVKVVEEVCSSSTQIVAYPDAIPALLELKKRKMKLIALTNGFYNIVVPVLRKTGVLRLLDGVITPDRVGAAKPSPEIFLVASKGADRPIFVGDNISVDICGANSAGIPSVLLWRNLPIRLEEDPREKAVRAHSLGLIYEKLRSEATSFLAPKRGCVPDFLIQSLKELIQVIEMGC